jgi:sterol desaturase/sphingolipid hydroxylase (fatty acid hydroxylase superfamily)
MTGGFEQAFAMLGIAGGLVFDAFTKFFSRFHWLSLLSAVLLAFACWLYQRHRDPSLRSTGFLAFLFPRKVWLHRSALLDYRFVLFDKVALGVVIGLVGLAGVSFAKNGSGSAASLVAGPQPALWLLVVYTLTLLLVEDFLRYWAHRLMHESPLLWQFHKVHHSPEVLVPFSQMRTHPVNGIVNLIRSGLAIVIVTGVFMLAFPGKLTALSILGVNAGRLVFDLMGSNLRHSHIWLSFGPRLSHIFISPAQHQIHHSKAAEHRNRNYGSQFAVWDWMFGTLYVPRQREQLTLGIDRDSTQRMQSIPSLYLEPFKDAAKLWRRRRQRDTRGQRLVPVRSRTRRADYAES